MEYQIYAILFIVSMFLAMVMVLHLGRRYAVYHHSYAGQLLKSGNATAEAAVFALLGLLVAFTFSTAAQRFDERRALIIEQANAIGTAYLRLDLFPRDLADSLKTDFHDYIETRLEIYDKLPNREDVMKSLHKSDVLQDRIWQKAVKGCAQQAGSHTCMLVLPALNSMFDIASSRLYHTQIHPPLIIFFFLIGVALLSSFLAGYNYTINQNMGGIFVLSYSFVITLTIYLIIDMEYPRLGLIRVNAFDQILVDLRKSMHPTATGLPG